MLDIYVIKELRVLKTLQKFALQDITAQQVLNIQSLVHLELS